MPEERVRHRLEMAMGEGRTGSLILKPPLKEQAYSVGAQALRLTPYRDWLNPCERAVPEKETEDGEATEEVTKYELEVDSERHLNGRAICLFDGLREAGVEVELGDSIHI